MSERECYPGIERAKVIFQARFTMDHIPYWATKPNPNGKFPGPQYASDEEWYKNTTFFTKRKDGMADRCHSINRTYPLGEFMDRVYDGRK